MFIIGVYDDFYNADFKYSSQFSTYAHVASLYAERLRPTSRVHNESAYDCAPNYSASDVPAPYYAGRCCARGCSSRGRPALPRRGSFRADSL